jgi:tRNA-splicing endonuclease subunit Sen2
MTSTQQIYTPIPAILPLFLTPPSTSPSAGLSIPTSLYPDDPFLVSYVCYHHFRSLGWVVKPGIKFCCDWLLYRRGPVFSHAACVLLSHSPCKLIRGRFSCVMVPVYSELGDRASSPYGHEDWYEERQSWKWINTVMRVNSLVQKVGFSFPLLGRDLC